MNKIKYNKKLNEVDIYGCITCPFLHSDNFRKDCVLDWKIKTDPPLESFPVNCPLREPNFKLVRHFDD